MGLAAICIFIGLLILAMICLLGTIMLLRPIISLVLRPIMAIVFFSAFVFLIVLAIIFVILWLTGRISVQEIQSLIRACKAS